jgi:hypothetical protein
MKRKLTAKIQQLKPTENTDNIAFAESFVIEPETRKLSLEKGTVYAVYNISSTAELDLPVISKVVHDVLHDGYFQAEGVSPTQTLEKVLLEIRNKVAQMGSENAIKFNMVATVLWGSVLYLVQFGTGKAYIVQEGEVRPVTTLSEGNFSASSGVVNDQDVVILATDEFDAEFPPEKLLSTAIPENTLKNQQAALLMKFVVDTEFSDEEVIDFGVEAPQKKSRFKDTFTGVIENIRKKGTDRKIKSQKKAYKTSKKLLPMIIVAALVLPLGASLMKGQKKVPSEKNPPPAEERLLGANVEAPMDPWEEEKEQDEKNNIIRVAPEAFYDIRIIEDKTTPTEIELVKTKIVVAAKETGILYISDIETPNFEKAPIEFPGIKSINDSEGTLSFSDIEGFKYFDVETNEIEKSYQKEALGITDTYLDFIYTVTGEEVIKYAKTDAELSGAVWGTSEDFENVTSMEIAYSIYLTTNTGDILKYTSGEKENFVLSGIETPLGNTPIVKAGTALDNIYIMDPENKRVLVVTMAGEVIKQYKTDKADTWNNMRDIAVADSEKVAYVLNGTKVFVFELDGED